jgi:hypothetical protein
MSIHPNNPKRSFVHWKTKLKFRSENGNKKAKQKLLQLNKQMSLFMKEYQNERRNDTCK